MTRELLEILANLSVASILLPLIPGLIFFSKHSLSLRVFAVFILLAAFFDSYSFISSARGINNHNILHLYTILELTCFGLFYFIYFRSKTIKAIILVAIALFIGFAAYYAIILNALLQFNSGPRVVECVILTGLALYFCYTLLNSDEHVNLVAYPYFWINSGVLIYFMGNVFVFMLFSIINHFDGAKRVSEFWVIHSVLNIVANLLYCVGFICSQRQLK